MFLSVKVLSPEKSGYPKKSGYPDFCGHYNYFNFDHLKENYKTFIMVNPIMEELFVRHPVFQ